jgi:hypothetical protein
VPEPAIQHRCPHCDRVFDSPSVCVESGEHTVPYPDVVPKQFFDSNNPSIPEEER